MRRKKHKTCRRIVKFYQLHFGFREPFKVLLDGNFIHTMSQLKYDNIESLVSSLLGAKVKVYVPSCVMRELRDLAKSDKVYKPALALARTFVRHKDGCPPTESTGDIFIKQAVNNNEQHWWFATQDRALWNTIQQDHKSAIPVLFASATGLHILPPPEELKASVTEKAKARMEVPQAEKDQALQAGLAKLAPRPRGRKKAAAPNPLSVRQSTKVRKSEITPETSQASRVRRQRPKQRSNDQS